MNRRAEHRSSSRRPIGIGCGRRSRFAGRHTAVSAVPPLSVQALHHVGHECGHALMTVLVGGQVTSITIRPDDGLTQGLVPVGRVARARGLLGYLGTKRSWDACSWRQRASKMGACHSPEPRRACSSRSSLDAQSLALGSCSRWEWRWSRSPVGALETLRDFSEPANTFGGAQLGV